MARQNVYDDPEFFRAYAQLRTSGTGLHERLIEPLLDELLPDLGGAQVVDIGCGDGWLCRIARARGAAGVVGFDPSERMLLQAIQLTDDPTVRFERRFAEDIRLAPGTVDCVVSILALHYVADLAPLFAEIAGWLRPRGRLAFLMEHPVVTSQNPKVGFLSEADGSTMWPVYRYFDQSPRNERWHVDGVIKHHKTVSAIVNALIDAGLVIERLHEPCPEEIEVADRQRPALLGVRAVRPARCSGE